MITLIANSGLQIHKQIIEIDTNERVVKKPLVFYEYFNKQTFEVSLEYAIKLPNDDIYSPKSFLRDQEYLDENDKFIDDNINPNSIIQLEEVDMENGIKDGYYKVRNIKKCLDAYENVWLPFPYFKLNSSGRSEFGPFAWTRIMLKNVTPNDSEDDTVRKYEVLIAFDTSLLESNEGSYYTPRKQDTKEPHNIFSPSDNDDFNLNFCNDSFGCGWVNDCLREIRIEKELPQYKSLEYITEYLYLIKYLSTLKSFYVDNLNKKEAELERYGSGHNRDEIVKQVKFFKDKVDNNLLPDVILYNDDCEETTPIDVDLVLDIGNSETCGLLFESPGDRKRHFSFNSVKRLELCDFSYNIGEKYSEPISMRMAFSKVKFGEIEIPEYQECFKWPSLVRVGREALSLISKYNIDKDLGIETATNNSSPKRYLWDDEKSGIPWEFIIPDKNHNSNGYKYQVSPTEKVYYEGISEQFKGGGEFSGEYDSSTTIMPQYSRKSLMTFVYIELFLHAIAQINSHRFRKDNDGSIKRLRRLRRVTITCPTSIVKEEQVALRQAAIDALSALRNYYSNLVGDGSSRLIFKNDIQVVPDPIELKRDDEETITGERKDWIYDEATCNQLVFLYSEIGKRYLNNSEKFFDLFGSNRNGDFEQRSLTIGSVDIGGGTTDLMIANYQYNGKQSSSVIQPEPVFWESFIIAGADLLKEIVKQVILEGEVEKDYQKGCKGVIRNYAIAHGVSDVVKKMQNFFGTDSPHMTIEQKIFRKNFNVQVLIPIAKKYLEHASSNESDKEVSYSVIFNEIKPAEELIDFLNDHFGEGFEFRDITWRLSSKRVSEIIESTFGKLFRHISGLLSMHNCDFVLLSGKLTSIPTIRRMFKKHYAVSPDRLISLRDYRVGRWYPNFGEKPNDGDLGYLKESKSLVAVGATIALMAGKLNKMEGFTLNSTSLNNKVFSTSNYIGSLDKSTKEIRHVYLTPKHTTNRIEISSLPILIGYKQLENDKYDGRPVYNMIVNESFIRKRVLNRNADLNSETEIVEAIENEKRKVLNKMPFYLEIERDLGVNKDVFWINSIEDVDGDEISTNMFSLKLMTLSEENHYWLDSGEFFLSIK